MKAYIKKIANYIPKNIITNEKLSETLDTNHEWIASRTGISQRYRSGKEETSLSMALHAINNLNIIEDDIKNIDAIIVATSTKQHPSPSTATLIQNSLEIKNCITLDLSAACSGYIYSINTATTLIESGQCETVLVVSSEKYSDIINWEDRGTAILFGDGCNATLLEKTNDDNKGIISIDLGSEEHASLLLVKNGGSISPITESNIDDNGHYVQMIGSEIFKHAIFFFSQSIKNILSKSSLTINDIDLIIPHQANIRIMKSLAKSMDVSMDKIFVNIQNYGNTSAASIGIALSEAIEQGKIKEGDNVVLAAFGAGLTWGSTLIKF